MSTKLRYCLLISVLCGVACGTRPGPNSGRRDGSADAAGDRSAATDRQASPAAPTSTGNPDAARDGGSGNAAVPDTRGPATDARDGSPSTDLSPAQNSDTSQATVDARVPDGPNVAQGMDAAPADAAPPPPDAPQPPPDAPPPPPDVQQSPPDTQPPLLARGESCTSRSRCASGHCVDGVCCEAACTGSCMQCNAAGKRGLCLPVPGGMPAPAGRTACTRDTEASCKQNGLCDGQGACAQWGTETVCRATTCSDRQLTAPSRCNGAGTCVAPAGIDCGNYQCNAQGTACLDACTGDAQCAPGVPCVSGRCGKQGQGSTCTRNADCTTGYCADGVCCDGECSGTCQACVAGKTGQPNGKCAPIIGGTDPDNDCATEPTSTCGRDGACDGSGACRRYAAGTICSPPACTNGAGNTASTQQSARTCDGAGLCRAPTSTSCGLLLCGPDQCRELCTDSSHCLAGNYCTQTGGCSPTLAVGERCTSSDQCQTGNCWNARRCCDQQCPCPTPSPHNLLTNPGFSLDERLSGWTPIAQNGFTFEWTSSDIAQCGFSGALRFLRQSSTAGTTRFSQCVPLRDPTAAHNFGFSIRWLLTEGPPNVTCSVYWHSALNCAGSLGGGLVAFSSAVDNEWEVQGGVVTPPSGAVSAEVSCNVNGYSIDVEIDSLYLSAQPATY